MNSLHSLKKYGREREPAKTHHHTMKKVDQILQALLLEGDIVHFLKLSQWVGLRGPMEPDVAFGYRTSEFPWQRSLLDPPTPRASLLHCT